MRAAASVAATSCTWSLSPRTMPAANAPIAAETPASFVAFDLLAEDLQDYREKSAGQKSGRLEKFSMTATQAILYFNSIAPGDTVIDGGNTVW